MTNYKFIFRSDSILNCQLILPAETAYSSLHELAKIGLFHFKDLNSQIAIFKRKYASDIKNCDKINTRIDFIKKQLTDNLMTWEITKNDSFEQLQFFPKDLSKIDSILDKTQHQLMESEYHIESLMKSYQEMVEMRHVLNYLDDKNFIDDDFNEINDIDSPMYCLNRTVGVVTTKSFHSMQMIIWRISRGNVFIRHQEISMVDNINRYKQENEQKSAFIIFYQGDILKDKIANICQAFKANLYNIPQSINDRNAMLPKIVSQIHEIQNIIDQSINHKLQILSNVLPNINTYSEMVNMAKYIFYHLNMCNYDSVRQCLIAEGWCPETAFEIIQDSINVHMSCKNDSIAPSLIYVLETSSNQYYPTYNSITDNMYMKSFQNILDSYGYAKYKEINPAIYTITTFPFLFSIMFGDLGHGLILLIIAFLLIKMKLPSKLHESEVFKLIYDGRYLILLMGFYSIYAGIIFNDLFSLSFNLFTSSWSLNSNRMENTRTRNPVYLNPYESYQGIPYFFGIDPIWHLSTNKLSLLNSFKMKFSIIIAFFHMLFGIVLNYYNFKYFNDQDSIYFRFIPELVFILSTIGYIVFLIFFKWIFCSINQTHPIGNIILSFIGMYLEPHSIPEDIRWFFHGQHHIQRFLFSLTIISATVLLVGKPLYYYMKSELKKNTLFRKNKSLSYKRYNVDEFESESCNILISNAEPDVYSSRNSKDEFHMDIEDFVYQIVHTIEFCLGCISNTASYLRLWALSLAHNQLSNVLWNMLLRPFLTMQENSLTNGVLLTVAFGVWAAFTVGILIFMEGLSAFLHTLRLHWVEFQNKFYSGTGINFHPFSYKDICDNKL